MHQDTKPTAPTVELRCIRAGKPELRASDSGKPVIHGHAAVFWDPADPSTQFEIVPGRFVERVMPTAFDRALAESDDVRGMYQHRDLLGRTTSGTVRLSKTDRGLHYEIDPPDTSAGRDACELLSRGDLDGSSFGFSIRSNSTDHDHWRYEGDLEIRELHSVQLLDVGPVIFDAYEGSSSSNRGTDLGELRARFEAASRDRTTADEVDALDMDVATAEAELRLHFGSDSAFS